MLLLLPVAYLCAAGQWWALLIPVADRRRVPGDRAGGALSRRASRSRSWRPWSWGSAPGRRARATAGGPRRPRDSAGGPAARSDLAGARDARGPGRHGAGSAPVLAVRRRTSTRAAATSSISPTRSCTAGPGSTSGPATERRDHRRRPVLRAVRAVPGDRAACRSWPSSGRSPRTSWKSGINAAPRGGRGRAVLDAARPGRASGSCATGSCWSSWSASRPRSCGSTTRGGVWHTGHLIATILTFICLVELCGQAAGLADRAAAGAAFLTRAPLAFAIPFYALLLVDWPRRLGGSPGAAGSWLALGVLPSIVFFFAYNQVRFGTPLESGYALATLPAWLEAAARPRACSRSSTSR